MELRFKGEAAIPAAAIVELEEDIALVREQLIARADPALGHGLDVRAAIDLHDGRARIGRRAVVRLEHGPVELGCAVIGEDRAEFGNQMAREEGRIGVVFIDGVFLDPGHALAGNVVERGLGRGVGIGIAADKARAALTEAHAPAAFAFGDLDRLAALKGHGVQMTLERARHPAFEIDRRAVFGQARDIIDHPLARGQGAHRAVRAHMIDVPEARAFGGPQEAAILERAEIIGEVDPGVVLLGEDGLGRAGLRARGQNVEHGLGAVLALGVQRAAVLAPVHPGEIDVGLFPEIDLRPFAGGHIDDMQLDQHVRRARARIALVGDGDALGVDAEAGHDLDRGLVNARRGDIAAIRAPPIAGVTAHLFLGDEFGDAPADRIAALGGQGALLAGFKIVHPEVLVADEAHIGPVRADAGVGFERLGLHQALGLAGVHIHIEDIAIERHEDGFTRLVPVIADDAGGGDAGALAILDLGFGQLPLIGRQHGGINQHVGPAIAEIHRPEIGHRAVVILGAQEGHALAIG